MSTKGVRQSGILAKPKKPKKELSYLDVQVAARGGDEAYRFYVENGKLPVTK